MDCFLSIQNVAQRCYGCMSTASVEKTPLSSLHVLTPTVLVLVGHETLPACSDDDDYDEDADAQLWR